jgi:hypothetical protein
MPLFITQHVLMQHWFEFRRVLGLALALLASLAIVAGLGDSVAWGVTPESPEVKAVVEKALKYLATGSDDRLGAQCLLAMAFTKNGRPKDDPLVKRAVDLCEDRAKEMKNEDNYSLGCAVIFLCELDPEHYKGLIEKYLREILGRQMKNGPWSYPDYQTGDTSQTQYAVLGMWMAQRHGIAVPQRAVEGVAGWLLRTQDVGGGGWAYQGTDPGNKQRIAQEGTTHSLTAAGLGSLYICADLLEITEVPVVDKTESNVPSVLREVGEPKKPKKTGRGISQVIDAGSVREAMGFGNQWFQKNGKRVPSDWEHYFMYAYERMRSYQELANGKAEKEPAWYNDGFARLKKTQQSDGSWNGQDNPTVATCFAVLFLSRSSRKSIAKVVTDWGEGILIGGMGLPPSTADIQERDGKVVEVKLTGSIDELLRIVEDKDNPNLSRIAESSDGFTLDSDVAKRAGQIDRLRALVSGGTYQSRLVAVRTLGKIREFDNVPLLIYALTDPDLNIVREADRGLRFISRKLHGVGLPDAPTLPTQQQLRDVQASWKAWYKSIRPEAEFLD